MKKNLAGPVLAVSEIFLWSHNGHGLQSGIGRTLFLDPNIVL